MRQQGTIRRTILDREHWSMRLETYIDYIAWRRKLAKKLTEELRAYFVSHQKASKVLSESTIKQQGKVKEQELK